MCLCFRYKSYSSSFFELTLQVFLGKKEIGGKAGLEMLVNLTTDVRWEGQKQFPWTVVGESKSKREYKKTC
jgi:hypothetical protein